MNKFLPLAIIIGAVFFWLQYSTDEQFREIFNRPSPSPTPTVTQQVLGATTQAKVTRIIDGDTIEIETGQKIRLIGIDTPEMDNFGKERECYALEAKNKLEEMVLDKAAVLEKDVSETDRFGRLLRYVWLDGEMVNEKMVREGYATAATFPPDVKYKDRFLVAESQAREKGLGLWGKCAIK